MYYSTEQDAAPAQDWFNLVREGTSCEQLLHDSICIKGTARAVVGGSLCFSLCLNHLPQTASVPEPFELFSVFILLYPEFYLSVGSH